MTPVCWKAFEQCSIDDAEQRRYESMTSEFKGELEDDLWPDDDYEYENLNYNYE